MEDHHIPGATDVNCSLKVKFVSKDNEIYQFDNTWTFNIDKFEFLFLDILTIQVKFSFQAQLHSLDENNNMVTLIPGEGMCELSLELERLESLLDLISLQIGVPLTIVDGSITCSGAGGQSLPVSNTYIKSITDCSGLQKRYKNIFHDKYLLNAIRFYRLSQIDKEYSGKGTKLWAVIEALYKSADKGIKTIWSKFKISEQKSIESTINHSSVDERRKKLILDILKREKIYSRTEILSKHLKLMNRSGKYTNKAVSNLLRWWSNSRNAPAHGERIQLNDRERIDAIDDMEGTIQMLLQSRVIPLILGYIVGNPEGINGKFWDKNDHTISKFTQNCWAKPIDWEARNYLIKVLKAHKKTDNSPLVYVTHDTVFDVMQDGMPIENTSSLPIIYQQLIDRVQKKLNKL